MEILKAVCQPYAWALIIVLVAIVFLQAAGMGLRPLLRAGLRRLAGGSEINVYEGTQEGRELVRHRDVTQVETAKHDLEMGGIMALNTKFCNSGDCQAFKRNEREIESLKTDVRKTNAVIFTKLTFIKNQNAVMLRAMVKGGQLNEGDIPKEPL
jgi:hypothetical protein